jgi:hypothetical protein
MSFEIHRMALVRTDVSEEHITSIFRVAKTLEFSHLAARICLTTDSEESLLQRNLHGRVNPLPWSYC